MLRDIHLHGALGARYGRHFRLAVDTPAEAVRALSVQLPGFRQAIAKADWHLIASNGSRATREDLDVQTMAWRFGERRHLHIVPAAAGAKNNGTTKIIIGVVILIAAVFTYGAALGWFGEAMAVGMGSTIAEGAMMSGAAGYVATTGWGASMAIQAGLFGASLIFAGVSQLLAPHVKGKADTSSNQQSFLFTGPVNTQGQGQVVPLIYGGPVRVGSILAGESLRTEEYAIDANAWTALQGQTGVRLLGVTS